MRNHDDPEELKINTSPNNNYEINEGNIFIPSNEELHLIQTPSYAKLSQEMKNNYDRTNDKNKLIDSVL